MTPIKMIPLALVILCACGSGKDDAAGSKRTVELADKLVTCENERNDLREKLQVAQADLTKVPELARDSPTSATLPRSGRTPPRKSSGADHDVLGERAAARSVPTGPENPEAEAKEANLVAQALQGHVGQFRPCYERGLKRNTNLQFVNQVKIHVTVSPTGHVRDVRLIPRADSDMEACIGQVVAQWPFPAYKGQAVVVEVPVNLKVQGQ